MPAHAQSLKQGFEASCRGNWEKYTHSRGSSGEFRYILLRDVRQMWEMTYWASGSGPECRAERLGVKRLVGDTYVQYEVEGSDFVMYSQPAEHVMNNAPISRWVLTPRVR